MNGFLNLYKPSGISSAQILNAIKKSIRRETIGHMGTLYPLASGVLPVAIGKSTRLFDYLLDKDKEYGATIAFGYLTDTLDLEGNIVERSDAVPTREAIENNARKLCGEIMQIPPAFSAKCINGKRSYELARKGKIVELPPKKVTINSIEIVDQTSDTEFKIKIDCKGGTYIRSIARDLGTLCGSCATMTSLVRTKSGVFDINDAVSCEDFVKSDNKESFIIKPENVVDYPILNLTDNESERLFNGLYDEFDFPDGTYRVFTPDKFYGVGELKNKKLKVKAYLRDD